MAIKTTLISTVNSFISVVVNIVKVKSALLEIINNFYGTIINEKETTVSKVITSANPSPSFQYDVDFVKQGRTVTMNGFIRNNSDFLENTSFLEIVSAEYLPAQVPGDSYVGTTLGDYYLSLYDDDNSLYATVPANTTVQFSLTYNTLN
jgi:hypothetical protein